MATRRLPVTPAWSKVVRYTGIFLAGLVVGGALVFWNGVRPMVQMLGLTTALHSDDNAYVKYRYAAYPVARRAILEHIRFVQAFAREHEDGPTLGKGSPSDLMLWYGRLAVSAERANKKTEAVGFLRHALEAARASGGDVTEAQVREIVRKQDADWDSSLLGDH
jgi:hypothetical protein